TAELARAMAAAIGEDARLLPVSQVQAEAIGACDLVVVGSPTQGGRPTQATQALLRRLPANALQGKRVAAVDTRFDPASHGFGLKLLMRVIGVAAPRILAGLEGRGGTAAATAEGFIVEDKQGPLRDGE